MALTKAQISLVTVSTLGIAPGGFAEDLAFLDSIDELLELIEDAGLLDEGDNGEFAQSVASRLNVTGEAAVALYEALEDGESRAEAAYEFAVLQQLNGNATLEALLASAEAYEGESIDFEELAEILLGEADEDEDEDEDEGEGEDEDALTIEFEDYEEDQAESEDIDDEEGQTVVNIGKAQLDAGETPITDDYTFTLSDQIGAGEEFEGLFLSPVIDRASSESTGSQLFVNLLDLRAAEDDVDPLERLPVNGFGFSMDGEVIEVVSEAIADANTYEELLAAVEARLEELANGVDLPEGADEDVYALLENFSVELSGTFTVKNQDGDNVSGTTLILTDDSGQELEPLGFSNRDGIIAEDGYTLYSQLDNVEPDTIEKAITTNLELDNIGYGSQGAAINIAGQSNSDKGLEEIKVTATNGVWLTDLSSKATTDHLERIVLQVGSNGYFRVGEQNSTDQLVDRAGDGAGLEDVVQLDATAASSVAIAAAITDEVLGRYEMDDTGAYADDNEDVAIDFELTSGDDVLRLDIAGEVLEQVDTTVSIETGEGADWIELTSGNGSGDDNWVTNQQLLDNVSIDAGAGNDWILTEAAGSANIDGGTGDDVIRVDNTGDQMADVGGADVARAVYVFNTNDVKLSDLLSNSDHSLSEDASGDAQSFNLFGATVTVTFKGFESEAIEIDSTNYVTSTLQINQAIKEAVNSNAVLNKLIWAVDNEGKALGIESLIDGVMTEGDLDITISLPAEDDVDADDLEAAAEAYGVETVVYGDLSVAAANGLYATDFAEDDDCNDIDGVNSSKESDNVVEGGKGDDVITLGTGSDSNDTLTFSGYNNGTDTIVNFTASEVVTTGGDSVADTQLIFADAATAFVVATTTQGASTYAGVDVAQVFEMKFSDITAGATNLTFVTGQQFGTIGAGADLVIDVSAGMTAAEVAAAVVADSTGTIGDFTVAVDPDDSSSVIFTSTTAGTGVSADITDMLLGTGLSVTTDSDLVITTEETTAAADAVGAVVADAEEFTVTINAAAVANGEITFDGETIPVLTGDSDTDIADSLAAGTYTNWTATAAGNVVTFVATANGELTDIEFDDFGGLVTVNADTPVVNTDTIMDYSDLLDFSNYLTSVDEFGAELAVEIETADFTAGNQVMIVDFSDSIELDGESVSFDDLSASDLLSILNGTEDADNAFDELDIDADSITDDLDQEYILMVQNDENEGEYKVFHLSAEADNAGDFADVNLVGTLDFGAEQTFLDANFVGAVEVA